METIILFWGNIKSRCTLKNDTVEKGGPYVFIKNIKLNIQKVLSKKNNILNE